MASVYSKPEGTTLYDNDESVCWSADATNSPRV